MARFLLHLLRSDWGQQAVKASDNGVAQPNVAAREIAQLQVPLPPLATQRKIVATLSAYDDLIENNNRRIKLLKEMAQRIYREWFVDLRYRGHEDVPLVASELGPIPQDWSVEPIGAVIDTLGGGTPSRGESTYWAGGTVAWYAPRDLTSAKTVFMFRSTEAISALGLSRSAARTFPAGSVMMTSRATIGVLAIAGTQACTNQGFITCVPNDRLSTYHLYFWLSDMRDRIEALATGATFKEISRSEFRTLPVLMPPSALEEGFATTVRPLFDAIAILEREQPLVRAARDLLLPRLISGEIDLEALDIAVQEAAA